LRQVDGSCGVFELLDAQLGFERRTSDESPGCTTHKRPAARVKLRAAAMASK
jgi:hypothetical protein